MWWFFWEESLIQTTLMTFGLRPALQSRFPVKSNPRPSPQSFQTNSWMMASTKSKSTSVNIQGSVGPEDMKKAIMTFHVFEAETLCALRKFQAWYSAVSKNERVLLWGFKWNSLLQVSTEFTMSSPTFCLRPQQGTMYYSSSNVSFWGPQFPALLSRGVSHDGLLTSSTKFYFFGILYILRELFSPASICLITFITNHNECTPIFTNMAYLSFPSTVWKELKYFL